ncbi:GNAT family N-acetyltransferase [Bacillus aerolatus]|uniref:GNAT family N-acetyltransferase n=2 Tax=Bacillus aerolatus TaxID=2653354 RepID=A0A6I1FNQ1_9BACI|nr:GNAT family N-acetyltransferase [Bacillus aerolatus]
MQVLEKKIWQMDPIPIHQTITAHLNGGLLIGAFSEEELIGYSYGFAGFSNGRTYLCSHMLGIHPDHQKKGIGEALKEAQRKEAIRLGYELLTWTFDPLESVNAYLNMTKLKAVCSTYVVNCYGEMNDGLNKGLPSDRLKVEWWIQSPYVNGFQTLNEKSAIKLADYEKIEKGLPKISALHLEKVETTANVIVPVPKNFQEIKTTNFALALDWRMKTREIFTKLFNAGYAAVKLIKSDDEPVHYYLFVQREFIHL